MHDIVIRNGTIIDGSGRPGELGDLAIDGDRIAQVGGKAGAGRRELDAAGKLVTPGFVDIHTHYDGQATWDPYLTPSSWHGVTSVVMGNCGVGFAPAKPHMRDWLIQLMEGVEDIPGAALAEGIEWQWDSFPEYMDALERMPRAVDVAVQVPHGALRVYVMGERGAKHEAATRDEIAEMSRLVEESVRAGALGFSTSRTLLHKGSDGELVPGTYAPEVELFGIGRGLQRAGAGVFQMTSNHVDMPKEFEWMRRLSLETGRPVSFNLLQTDEAPDLWREMLAKAEAAHAEGARVAPSVAGRPAGILMGWQCTASPFLGRASFHALADLPWTERLARLRDPAVKAAILADTPMDLGSFGNYVTRSFHKMFPLGARPDYEPDAADSVAARAARLGKDPLDVAYDALLEDEGDALIYFPIFNYSYGHMDQLREMLLHPLATVSLGDGGAHCGAICDASIQTFMLTHWARDRRRGPKLPLETAVMLQTSKTARLYGLGDRGLLQAGLRADVNVIDFEGLTLHAPKLAWDLPAGGRRLVQTATGYDATIAAGELIMERGEKTGALPGRLIRGAR